MMFLLVSAVVLLVSPALANPAHQRSEGMSGNLNQIIELAKKYNDTLTKEYYVEDVTHLVEGGCEHTFFCKVYDILHKHQHFGKRKEDKAEQGLVRNLKQFIDGENKNCTELMKNMTSTGKTRTIPTLIDNLAICIRRKNLAVPRKSD